MQVVVGLPDTGRNSSYLSDVSGCQLSATGIALYRSNYSHLDFFTLNCIIQLFQNIDYEKVVSNCSI